MLCLIFFLFFDVDKKGEKNGTYWVYILSHYNIKEGKWKLLLYQLKNFEHWTYLKNCQHHRKHWTYCHISFGEHLLKGSSKWKFHEALYKIYKDKIFLLSLKKFLQSISTYPIHAYSVYCDVNIDNITILILDTIHLGTIQYLKLRKFLSYIYICMLNVLSSSKRRRLLILEMILMIIKY